MKSDGAIAKNNKKSFVRFAKNLHTYRSSPSWESSRNKSFCHSLRDRKIVSLPFFNSKIRNSYEGIHISPVMCTWLTHIVWKRKIPRCRITIVVLTVRIRERENTTLRVKSLTVEMCFIHILRSFKFSTNVTHHTSPRVCQTSRSNKDHLVTRVIYSGNSCVNIPLFANV